MGWAKGADIQEWLPSVSQNEKIGLTRVFEYLEFYGDWKGPIFICVYNQQQCQTKLSIKLRRRPQILSAFSFLATLSQSNNKTSVVTSTIIHETAF